MTKEKFSATSYETAIVYNNTYNEYIKITKVTGQSKCTVELCRGSDELIAIFEMSQEQAMFICRFILPTSKNRKSSTDNKAQIEDNKSEKVITIEKDEILDCYVLMFCSTQFIKDPDTALEMENEQAKLFARSILKLYKKAN